MATVQADWTWNKSDMDRKLGFGIPLLTPYSQMHDTGTGAPYSNALGHSSLKQPPPPHTHTRMWLLLACVGRECCVYCIQGGVRIRACGNCAHTRVFVRLCTDCDNGCSLWRTKTIYLCLVRKSLVGLRTGDCRCFSTCLMSFFVLLFYYATLVI